jgi:uncharacterized protein YcsI (UPF0317 family)
MNGAEARALLRSGAWRRSTSGLAPGWMQANLVVVQAAQAGDFERFCRLNPKPCPLIDMTAIGSPRPMGAAPEADLRVDVGRYRVYRKGMPAEEVDDIRDLWQPDFVAFLLGCSFTFETALANAGIGLRHMEMGRTVSMYRTNRQCETAGVFHGPLVVSMRPVPGELVIRAAEITAGFPLAHGGPVHAGDPAVLGIADLERPDYGDSVPLRAGEVPVFWACGVTPQAAAVEAGIDLMITHAPGHMFITDLRDEFTAGGLPNVLDGP